MFTLYVQCILYAVPIEIVYKFDSHTTQIQISNISTEYNNDPYKASIGAHLIIHI